LTHLILPHNATDDPKIKRYNTQKKPSKEEEALEPPVILYSDTYNNNGEDDIMMKERGSKAGARLSKYNFLSQAFSQMRTSYGGGGVLSQQFDPQQAEELQQRLAYPPLSPPPPTTQPAAPELLHSKTTGDRSYHDSMVLSPYELSNNTTNNATARTEKQEQQKPRQQQAKYQMYSMYNNSTSDALSPIPPPSATASTFFDANRESTMTVGTLHAPLFLSQHQQNPTPTSPPVNKHHRVVYAPNLALNITDGSESVVSDVSQYNTFPRQQTPINNNNTTSNKSYPFF
jgi:hypothetical protein